VLDDVGGEAAEDQAREPATAVGRHDDHVGTDFVGDVQHRRRGRSGSHDDLDLETLVD
jgi:hypothetical protein